MNATAELAVGEQQIVVFHLAGELYGVDIALIQEIIRLSEITRVPNTSPEIEGIINLRGRIVPIVDLRRCMGLPSAATTSTTRIFVLALEEHTVGVIVDRAEGVIRLPETQIEPPSQLMTLRDQDFVRGVGKTEENMIILLNVPKVLGIKS